MSETKTLLPNGIPRFIHDDVVEHLEEIQKIMTRNLTPLHKVDRIEETFRKRKQKERLA